MSETHLRFKPLPNLQLKLKHLKNESPAEPREQGKREEVSGPKHLAVAGLMAGLQQVRAVRHVLRLVRRGDVHLRLGLARR